MTMEPWIFRKEDAKSILTIDMPWRDVLDKPAFFDKVSEIMVNMMGAAATTELLTRPDTLRTLKKVVSEVLIDPLNVPLDEGGTESDSTDEDGNTENRIKVDAFWDEFTDVDMDTLKAAIERAYLMYLKINQSTPLTNASTLMDTKETVNETILKPLKGIDEDN